MMDEELRELFGPGFDYFGDYLTGDPTPQYFWFRKRQRILEIIARNRQIIPRIVIELGCGDGTDLFLLNRRFHDLCIRPLFIGADANASSVRICNLKRSHYGARNVSFTLCDFAVRLPFRDGQSDLVYCSEVLEHLRQPEILLAEIARVLSPRGFLLMTTPNEPNVFQRSYWRANRRKSLGAVLSQSPDALTRKAGRHFYGHISVKPIAEWERLIADVGLRLVDYERGALLYTSPFKKEFAMAAHFAAEAMLDWLPKRWTRKLSDEMIGLYQKT